MRWAAQVHQNRFSWLKRRRIDPSGGVPGALGEIVKSINFEPPGRGQNPRKGLLKVTLGYMIVCLSRPKWLQKRLVRRASRVALGTLGAKGARGALRIAITSGNPLRMGSHYEWGPPVLATVAVAITNGWIASLARGPPCFPEFQEPNPIPNHRQNVTKKHS